MSCSQDLTKIEEFELDLIECMRQPGRLRLSRRACGLQYRLAQRKNHRVPNDEFGMVRRMSLEICRTCPEGRLCSESLQEESSEQKKNLQLRSRSRASSFSDQRNRRSNFVSLKER